MEDYFILPFTLGMITLFAILLVKYGLWIAKLSHRDKLRIIQSFLTRRTFGAIKESFMEGLIHHNVFKRNLLLGYMHMSLAFGWFLLIVVGHAEVVFHYGSLLATPWETIF